MRSRDAGPAEIDRADVAQRVTARRTDDGLGIREEAAFFGSERGLLFGFQHRPLSPPLGSVLICSPLLAEFRKNYRKEFQLGRSLATNGLAVQRFHYRGTGNSDGEASGVTMTTLTTDAFTAGRQLIQAVGQPIRAVVGTRLGTFVAGHVASRVGARALVLWEPELSARTFFREAHRASLLRSLRDGGSLGAQEQGPLAQQLAERGRADVLGYTIHRGLYDSVLESRLDGDGMIPPARHILWLASAASASRQQTQLVDRWRANGASVDVEYRSAGESWWLLGNGDGGSDVQASDEAVQLTSRWILEKCT